MAGALGVWGENLCIKCTVKRNTGLGLAAALCPVKLKVQSIVIRNQLFGDLKNMMEGLLNTLHFPKHLSPGFPGVCPQDHCSHEERIIVAALVTMPGLALYIFSCIPRAEKYCPIRTTPETCSV